MIIYWLHIALKILWYLARGNPVTTVRKQQGVAIIYEDQRPEKNSLAAEWTLSQPNRKQRFGVFLYENINVKNYSNSLRLPKAFRFFSLLETARISAENGNAAIKITGNTTRTDLQYYCPQVCSTITANQKRRMTVNCARNYWESSPEI